MSLLDTLDRRGLAMLADMAPAPTAPRCIPVILLEIAEVDANLSRLTKLTDLTDAEHAQWTRLDNRLDDLRVELSREVKRVTGATLEQLGRAA